MNPVRPFINTILLSKLREIIMFYIKITDYDISLEV